MLITFTSVVTPVNGEEQKIQFSSNVVITEWNGFTVFEFEEPKMKEMNRIEVKAGFVNIFAGAQSFNLELNNDVPLVYNLGPQGILKFTSYMKELSISEELIDFKYTLANEEDKIGDYRITLEIKKEA